MIKHTNCIEVCTQWQSSTLCKTILDQWNWEIFSILLGQQGCPHLLIKAMLWTPLDDEVPVWPLNPPRNLSFCFSVRLWCWDFFAFLMKLRWKFMFQGPPQSLLHHDTALKESDSRMIWLFFKSSLAKEIAIALWMARTSAQLISMNGMGEENKHLKIPWWFRSTPPMAEQKVFLLTEASTFHFTQLMLGGSHNNGGDGLHFVAVMLFLPFHTRHEGFLWISDGE